MQGLRDPSAAMWHVLQLALAAVCGLAPLSALPAPTARKPLSRRRPSSAAAGRERMLQVQRTMYDRTSEPTYFPSGPLLLTGYITFGNWYILSQCHDSERSVIMPTCPSCRSGIPGPASTTAWIVQVGDEVEDPQLDFHWRTLNLNLDVRGQAAAGTLVECWVRLEKTRRRQPVAGLVASWVGLR
jgi:hypothetical protein